MADIVERLRLMAGFADHDDDQGWLNDAADEIERLRAVCGAMDDPSRTSRFEWNEDLTMVRTVTTTAWRSAVGGAPGVSETHTDPKEAPQ